MGADGTSSYWTVHQHSQGSQSAQCQATPLGPEGEAGVSSGPGDTIYLVVKNKCATEAHLLNTAWGTFPRDSLFQHKWHRKLFSFMCQQRMYLKFLRGKADSTTNLH